jgi:hypothetical protein
MPEAELQELIDSPGSWPLRPFLPMKRMEQDGISCGYLIEQHGLTIFYPDGSELRSFTSVREMHGAGWRVD